MASAQPTGTRCPGGTAGWLGGVDRVRHMRISQARRAGHMGSSTQGQSCT